MSSRSTTGRATLPGHVSHGFKRMIPVGTVDVWVVAPPLSCRAYRTRTVHVHMRRDRSWPAPSRIDSTRDRRRRREAGEKTNENSPWKKTERASSSVDGAGTDGPTEGAGPTDCALVACDHPFLTFPLVGVACRRATTSGQSVAGR